MTCRTRKACSVSVYVIAVVLVGWMAIGGARAKGAAPPAAPPATAAANQSSQEALTLFADGASYQKNNKLDLAAEQWKRFLKRFGDDPLAVKAQYYLGVCLLELKKYDEAAAAFQVVIDKYPAFAQLEDAYLNLGWAQYSSASAKDKALYRKAADIFSAMIQKYPKGKYIDQALYFLGESNYSLGEKKEATKAYGKLVTGHPKSKLRSEALYALGVTLAEIKSFDFAVKAYDMFLKDYPKDALATEIRMRKAEVVLQRGDAASAEKMFAEVVAVKGFQLADYALFRQAYCAAKQDKFAEAGVLYSVLTERFPESTYYAQAVMSAGRCYYRASQFAKAIPWFEWVVEHGDTDKVEAAHWLCRGYLDQQQPDKALATAKLVLPKAKEGPFLANLKLDQADAMNESKEQRPAALKQYLAIFQAYPKHAVAAQALYDAAFAALELRQFDQAATLADTFLKTFPKDALIPDTLYVAAECLIQKKDYKKAEEIYRQLLKQAPDHAEHEAWQVRLGLVLYLQKQYEATIKFFNPLVAGLQSADARAEANYLIGMSHFQLGQFTEATQALRAALLANAKWRQAEENLLFLARAQLKAKQSDAAISTLALLKKNFPKSSLLDQAAYYGGEYYYAAGRLAESVAAYDELLSTWPTSPFVPFALYGKGWALIKSRKYAPASACFSKLIDIKPPHRLHTDSLFARAMCLRQLKKYAEAIADIDQFLATKPEGSIRFDALYERGLAESSADKTNEAIATFTTLLKEAPDYSSADNVLYELGWAYTAAKKNDQATKTFASLAAKYPKSPLAAEALFHVAEEAYSRKQFDAAARTYQQALERSDNSALREKVLYKSGWSYYQQQKYSDALKQFTSQLATYPKGDLAPDGWFMKAECLFKSKDYDKALPAFEKAAQYEPSSPQVAELTLLHTAQTLGQLGKWEDALKQIASFFQKFPKSDYLAEAFFEQARAQQKLGRVEPAIKDYQRAVDLSRAEVGARAQFMIGEAHFQQKNYSEAIKDFQRVMFRYGTDVVDAEIRRWQVKSAFEAARCSELQIESAERPTDRQQQIGNAVRFYRFVLEQDPKGELAKQSKIRIEALSKL